MVSLDRVSEVGVDFVEEATGEAFTGLDEHWIEHHYHVDIFHKRASFGGFLPSLENLNLLPELKISF